MKKAFTLIELLVVIAIIAILAAILFPVFAQAKAAAKRTAMLSNTKQTILSAIMYESDNDDVLPLITAWGSPGVNNGAYVYFNNQGCIPWTQLIQPYSKNSDILIDPSAAVPLPVGAGFNPAAKNLFAPNLGMNPYLAQSSGASLLSPRNGTAIARPADTVMFASKYSTSETKTQSWFGGWWFNAGTYFITISVDPPDCGTNTLYCADGYNNNTFYGGTGGQKELNNVEAYGAWTGGASLRGRLQSTVGWADGHSKSMAPGALAAGTNYIATKDGAGIPTQLSSAIVLQDKNIEHWYGNQ
jgi:prepilin-type N-terminal cleavage/methylation domain-containing protein